MFNNIMFNNIIRTTLKNAQSNEIISICETPNTVTNTGRQLFLDMAGGDETGTINIGCIGHGVGTTSAGTSGLVTELLRKTAAYTRAGTVGTFSTFFNRAEANSGEIKEIGFFGGSSSFTSSQTGRLFNRILLSSGITKTSSYTLTIDCDIQIS